MYTNGVQLQLNITQVCGIFVVRLALGGVGQI